MHHRIAILTCVSNVSGVGPGHSALVVGDMVWTFEQMKGPMDSGWLIIDLKSYLKKNEHRPVVVQELSEKVNPSKALRYVSKSISRDDDYATSGVCSSQVASAIEAGTVETKVKFNPKGIDTPRNVYLLAKRRGLVKRTYYYWPGAGGLGDFVRAHLLGRMESEYADVPLSMPNAGIATW